MQQEVRRYPTRQTGRRRVDVIVDEHAIVCRRPFPRGALCTLHNSDSTTMHGGHVSLGRRVGPCLPTGGPEDSHQSDEFTLRVCVPPSRPPPTLHSTRTLPYLTLSYPLTSVRLLPSSPFAPLSTTTTAAATATGLITEPPFRSRARHERRVSVMELWRPPRSRVTNSRRTARPRSSRASRSPSSTWRASTSGVRRTTGNVSTGDALDSTENALDWSKGVATLRSASSSARFCFLPPSLSLYLCVCPSPSVIGVGLLPRATRTDP